MWKIFKIKDKNHAISARKNEEFWSIFLTDFISIWKEELRIETIVERCKSLNPLLRIDGLNIHEIIDQILEDIPQYVVEVSENYKISLNKNFQGGRFKFKIDLNKASSQEYFEKDQEIAEYKAEGAKLIRKNIETKPFTEDSLKLKQAITGNSFEDLFQSLVDLFNEAEKINLIKNERCSEETKRSEESIEIKLEPSGSSEIVPQSSEITNSILDSKSINKDESKRISKRKQAKGSITASFTKPIKKPKSRVTNFIS